MSTVSGTTKNGATVDVRVYEPTMSITKADSFSPFIVCESKTNMSDSDEAKKILEENAATDTKVIDGKNYDLVSMDGSRGAYYLPSSGKRSMRALEMGRAASEFLEDKTSGSDRYQEIDPNQLFMDRLAVRLEERAKQLGCDFKDLTEEDINACSEEIQNEIASLILEKAIEVTEENNSKAMQYKAELQKKIDTNDFSPETAMRLAKATEIDKTFKAEYESNARLLGGSHFEKDFGEDLDACMDLYTSRGRSGDIGTYCTYILDVFNIDTLFVYHSNIYNHEGDRMLASGSSRDSGTFSSNSAIHGCAYVPRWQIQDWYEADNIHKFHLMRVSKQVTPEAIENSMETVYQTTKDKGYTLLNFDRNYTSGGTYCNQIPYLVWRNLGVDIRDYSGGYKVLPGIIYYTNTYKVLWWYVTVTYPVIVDVRYCLNDYIPLIRGENFNDDDDTYEVWRAK